MGYDSTYTEYHLTPRGWVEGSWAANKQPQSTSPPPEDRIETWIEKETTHDTYISKPTREWKLIWASPDYSEEERKKMRANIRNEVVTRIKQFGHQVVDFPI